MYKLQHTNPEFNIRVISIEKKPMGMDETKPYRTTEINDLKNLNGKQGAIMQVQ